MEIVGCEMLREVTRGCRLVLLTATEAEAEPLRVAFSESERHLLATKTLYVGDIHSPHPRLPNEPEAVIRTVLAISGCDKANVAHALTCLLQSLIPPPVLVLQVGIAGALPSSGLRSGAAIGDLVIATQEVYSDTGSSSPDGWIPAGELGLPIGLVGGTESGGSFPLDYSLVKAAIEVIEAIDWTETNGVDTSPALLSGPCVTSSMATGLRSDAEATAKRWSALAESMEGAAAAHLCALYGVPFLEVRGISNLADDRDRDAWQVDRAVAVMARAALAVVAALDTLPVGGEAGGDGEKGGD